ncbi:MAG TPA: nucleotidyltransferase family protein [Candidatus Acidoferrum sp.]|nr:nucleotidyltransferase family protein [Candidatus Acidoferrum sp.]
MIDQRSKLAVLATLSRNPDFSGLDNVPSLDSSAGSKLIQWLDRSGLALSFWKGLETHKETSRLSEEWRDALSQRQIRNIARMQDMFAEAARVHSVFCSFGIQPVVLKGFTLYPDFCDDPLGRHQTDFDFLVAARELETAAAALESCGYSTDRLNRTGETCFVTPLRYIPTSRDDLYMLQRQRLVDLHVSILEPCEWLCFEIPKDCLEQAKPQMIGDCAVLGLSLEDKFLLQVIHIFHHSFRSWIRLSWLLELTYCLEKHRENGFLWNRVIQRAGTSNLMKSVFAFVLGLATRIFRASIPTKLQEWAHGAITVPLRAWLDRFGFDWATTDWPGNLNNLFLTSEFIPNRSLRLRYWHSRLVPRKGQASIGSIAADSPAKFLQWQQARAVYLAKRATVHLKDLASLPRQRFRWKRALHDYRRLSFDANC